MVLHVLLVTGSNHLIPRPLKYFETDLSVRALLEPAVISVTSVAAAGLKPMADW